MTQKFPGSAQGSIASTPLKKVVNATEIEFGGMEPLVDNSTPKQSSVLPTELCPVELKLSLGGKEGEFKLESLIVAPTYQAALGIFREVSAYISSIALRVQSNGE